MIITSNYLLMAYIKLNINNVEGQHKCYGTREGDWIVFRCPLCQDFERRVNKKTGEMKSEINPSNPHSHYGFHIPPGLDTDLYNPN